jgi:transcriptional/translational regulatory protein YebC/TACO1
VDEDELMEAALEAGADDVVINDDGSFDVMTEFTDFMRVKDALVSAGFTPEKSELVMIPSTTVTLDKESAEKILALVDMLEDLDDVQNVYTNADIPEDILEQME